jgi:hypothetical protein
MHKTSLIYAHPWLYQGIMRTLYGAHFSDRYRALAAEVPPRCSVVEVCAGDCYLYENYLRHKQVIYQALDISEPFVEHARARGIDARVFDLWRDEPPKADLVLMQASLCQFLAQAAQVVERLRCVARRKLIIAESVRNLSTSRWWPLAALSRYLTQVPGQAGHANGASRFDVDSLTRLFESISGFERSFLIPGGREMVGIFTGGAA